MVNTQLESKTIWDILYGIPDPEVPVLSIVDLGVVREVTQKENKWIVIITPTYSGCPAMDEIESDIRTGLREAGIPDFDVKTSISPPWNTDMISEKGRQALQDYGIVPPQGSADKSHLTLSKKQLTCPQCKSTNTELVSQFGSTACKAQFKCNDCLEPFDYFKCLR